MKKTLFVISLLSLSVAQAALIPTQPSTFADTNSGVSVHYPCSGDKRGVPLVIYSMPINNKAPISSKETIYPLYVHPGYDASPLLITERSKTSQTSMSNLIIVSPNPAMDINSVSFKLQRQDGKEFHVDTINFAAIQTSKTEQFVASYKIVKDNNTLNQIRSPLPIRMNSFDQDLGVFVFANVKTIESTLYAWNQLGQWSGGAEVPYQYHPVAYRFTPEQSPQDKNFYNGYGFWICGSDTPRSADRPLQQEELFYRDTL